MPSNTLQVLPVVLCMTARLEVQRKESADGVLAIGRPCDTPDRPVAYHLTAFYGWAHAPLGRMFDEKSVVLM
jgi:hypothetical protein